VRPRAKVTIESLYEVVYEKSIGAKMNDLDLCLAHGGAAAWTGWVGHGSPKILVGWATMHLAPPIIGLYVR